MITRITRLRVRRILMVFGLLGLTSLGPASATKECLESPIQHEPMVLRDQRIPTYQVFETFLLHAGVTYEMLGMDAYNDFLREYGLDPDLQSIRGLPLMFDQLEKTLSANSRKGKFQKERRLGEIFAGMLAGIESDGAGERNAGREFRLKLQMKLRVREKITSNSCS